MVRGGQPSLGKLLLPRGETLGDTSHLGYTFLSGYRCHACRKVILSF
jgi:hypothetical protein